MPSHTDKRGSASRSFSASAARESASVGAAEDPDAVDAAGRETDSASETGSGVEEVSPLSDHSLLMAEKNPRSFPEAATGGFVARAARPGSGVTSEAFSAGFGFRRLLRRGLFSRRRISGRGRLFHCGIFS